MEKSGYIIVPTRATNDETRPKKVKQKGTRTGGPSHHDHSCPEGVNAYCVPCEQHDTLQAPGCGRVSKVGRLTDTPSGCRNRQPRASVPPQQLLDSWRRQERSEAAGREGVRHESSRHQGHQSSECRTGQRACAREDRTRSRPHSMDFCMRWPCSWVHNVTLTCRLAQSLPVQQWQSLHCSLRCRTTMRSPHGLSCAGHR
jgi:hypothetical protein